jgi:hypothetical protein
MLHERASSPAVWSELPFSGPPWGCSRLQIMDAALVGGAFAILGGVLGYVFSSLRDTKLSHRERVAKLRERQIAALVSFIHAADDLYRATQKINEKGYEIRLAREHEESSRIAPLRDEFDAATEARGAADSAIRTEMINLRLLAPSLSPEVWDLYVDSHEESFAKREIGFASRDESLKTLFGKARDMFELTDDVPSRAAIFRRPVNGTKSAT